MQRTIIVIAGPTASGKSALALRLAAEHDGVIINADSMQAYRDLPILTARPSEAEVAQAPHRLYGFMEPDQQWSAGAWLSAAERAITEAHAQGKLPIVVGGTGMYLRALTQGLAPIPDTDPAHRQEAEEQLATLGPDAFYQALIRRDPLSEGRVDQLNPRRLLRAWEVHAQTGRSLYDWHRDAPRMPYAPEQLRCFRVSLARETLYARCDARFSAMLDTGALDEVRQLLATHPSLTFGSPIFRVLGAEPLALHLRGELPLEEAARLAMRDTRHYAKRQETWLRNQMPEAQPVSPEEDLPAI